MDNKNNLDNTSAADLKDEAHDVFDQLDQLHNGLNESRKLTEQALAALEQNLSEQKKYYEELDVKYQAKEKELSENTRRFEAINANNAIYDQMAALTDDPAMKENIERLRESDAQQKAILAEENERRRQEYEELKKQKEDLTKKLENAERQVNSFKEQVNKKYNNGVQNTVAQVKSFTSKCINKANVSDKQIEECNKTIVELEINNAAQANLITILQEQNASRMNTINELEQKTQLQQNTIDAMKVVSAEQSMQTLEKSDAFTQLNVKPIKLNVVYNGSIYGIKEGGNYETGRVINKSGVGEDCRMIAALERNDVFIDSRVNRQGDIHKAYVPVNDEKGAFKGYAEVDMKNRTTLTDNEKKALIDAVNSDHGTAVRDIVNTVEYNLGNEGLDDLTQLGRNKYGRTWLKTDGLTALKRGDPVSIILIDGDTFKSFNTKYGYAGGDAVLKHISDSMKKASLESMEEQSHKTDDTGDRRNKAKHCSIRKGGDEFVMYFAGDGPDAYKTAKRIQELVSGEELKGSYVMDGEFDNKTVKQGDPASFKATVSVGVVEIRLSEEEREALTEDNVVEIVSGFMEAANNRLDIAKKEGVTGIDSDGREIKRAGVAKADPETEHFIEEEYQNDLQKFKQNYKDLFGTDISDNIDDVFEDRGAYIGKDDNIYFCKDTGYECIMLKAKAEKGKYRLDIGGDMNRVDYDTFFRNYESVTEKQLEIPAAINDKPQTKLRAFEIDGAILSSEDEKNSEDMAEDNNYFGS